MNKFEERLAHSHKLEIMVRLLSNQSIKPLLSRLGPPQLVQAHQFLWDSMVDFHARAQKSKFHREIVTQKMKSSVVYQREKGCDLRLDNCKGVECIWSNPECAAEKIINNMDVMGSQIMGYFRTLKHEYQAHPGKVEQ